MTVLKRVRDALLTVTPHVYHYQADGAHDKYIVWAEDGQAGTVWADDRMTEQAVQGAAHYFTREEYDPAAQAIRQALDDAGIACTLGSVQYEPDTGYIHTEWIWET